MSMVLLVFVHQYNMHERYLQPWTIPTDPIDFTGFIEYFLANGIFRFRIPMLFIISGFLFAMNDHRPYRDRVKKRFRTLVIPYLAWSAIGLIFTYLLELAPYSREIVANSHVVQIDNTRLLLHDYKWYELLGRWLYMPVPYQLWFIRILFIYNLSYPMIRWCILNRIARWFLFSFAFLLWLSNVGFFFIEGEGLLFFSLGIYLRKSGFSIEQPKVWLRPGIWGILFLSLAFAKTLIAFTVEPYLGKAIYPILLIMHKLMVLSGLIACWFGLDPLVRWCMNRKWFIWLTAFAFIIYAMHTPLVAYCIDPVLGLLANTFAPHMIAFICLPVVIITLCVGTGFLLRTVFPRVYGTLTGGRGM